MAFVLSRRNFAKTTAKASFYVLLCGLLPFSQALAETKTKPEIKSETKAGEKKVSNPTVEIITSVSPDPIEVELDQAKAPISVENFLKYVDEGFYDGTIFHRVISNFMIQGGGFNDKMSQKPTREKIKNEADNGLKNTVYTLAMARTSEVNSATSQFFINVKDNDFLNYKSPSEYGYAVFGKVTNEKGKAVVDKIKAVPTGNKNGMGDVPTSTVTIKSIKRTKSPSKDHGNDGVPSV